MSVTRVPPAEKRSPPVWRIVPAAVAGSIDPPLIGNFTCRPRADALPVGATFTPSDASAFAVPLSTVSRVWPPDRCTAACAAGATASSAPTATMGMSRFTKTSC